MTDHWTPMMVDAAVSFFGVWVENRLNQYDKDKPRYRLEDLLREKSTSETVTNWLSNFGIKVQRL